MPFSLVIFPCWLCQCSSAQAPFISYSHDLPSFVPYIIEFYSLHHFYVVRVMANTNFMNLCQLYLVTTRSSPYFRPSIFTLRLIICNLETCYSPGYIFDRIRCLINKIPLSINQKALLIDISVKLFTLYEFYVECASSERWRGEFDLGWHWLE